MTLQVPKRVAIVALGPSSHRYIEEVDHVGDRKKVFDETWTFNSYCSVIDSDRLFHMDDVKLQERRGAAGNQRVANMLEAMKRYTGPIYSSFPEPEYPTMEAYPIAEVASKYSSLYFTSTPPYALAYAGYIGVEEVYIYGCDYTWPGIAAAETGRACMEFWAGLLIGRGMKVMVHPESSLMHSNLLRSDNVAIYGYDRVHMQLKEVNGDGSLQLHMKEKELPTAEEIEARYDHMIAGTAVQLDVVN